MSEITRILSPELTRAIGWTLLHSLWQGLAIVLVLVLLMSALRRQSPEIRYLVSLAGLAGLMLSSAVTFLWYYRPVSLSAGWRFRTGMSF